MPSKDRQCSSYLVVASVRILDSLGLGPRSVAVAGTGEGCGVGCGVGKFSAKVRTLHLPVAYR